MKVMMATLGSGMSLGCIMSRIFDYITVLTVDEVK